jgi:hypothetical protein
MALVNGEKLLKEMEMFGERKAINRNITPKKSIIPPLGREIINIFMTFYHVQNNENR